VAQDFAGFDADDADDDDFSALPDPEVARIVLELDRTIMRNRRAAALRQIVQGQPVPLPLPLQVPIKPSRVELLVLTALVLTYGPVLFGSEFGPVLEQIAECGAVVLLQQVVFAEPTGAGIEESGASPARRAAARLQDARPMFEALCRKFPGTFLADARVLLKRFTARPDGYRKRRDG
jgi:hypothetical protein